MMPFKSCWMFTRASLVVTKCLVYALLQYVDVMEGEGNEHTSFSSYPINLFGPDVSSIGLPSGLSLSLSFIVIFLLF